MKKRDPNGFQILGLTFYRHSGRDLLTIDTVAGGPWFLLTIQDICVQHTEVVLKWLLWIKEYSDILWWLCVWSNLKHIWSRLISLWPNLDLTLTSHWCCGEGGSWPAVFKVSTRYIVVLYSQFYYLSYIYYLHIVTPPPILCVYNVHVIRSVGVCTIIYTLLVQRLS